MCCLHSVWIRIFSSFDCLWRNWNSYMKLLGVVIVHCNKLQGPLNDKINLIIWSKGACSLSYIIYARWETSSSICQSYSWTKSGRVWNLKNYPILMIELGRNHKYSGCMQDCGFWRNGRSSNLRSYVVLPSLIGKPWIGDGYAVVDQVLLVTIPFSVPNINNAISFWTLACCLFLSFLLMI